MHTPPSATALEQRERLYIVAYLEFFRRPYDWTEDGLKSPISTFAPVREWLAGLTNGLNVVALKRAMRTASRKHKDGPPLDVVRREYFAELAEARAERTREQIASGACVHCGNTGRVYVAVHSAKGRPKVIAPATPPRGLPQGSVWEEGVACSCVAGDEWAKERGWSEETRRRFVRHAVTRSQWYDLRAVCESGERQEPEEAQRELF